jgi:endonuclease/exonuclease/phosphatase (EEP) superfamily protein YafD
VIWKAWTESGVTIALVLLLSIPLISFYTSSTTSEAKGGIKIASINLLASNTDVQSVTEFIMQNNFDVLVFLEFTPEWEKALKKLNRKYPNQVLKPIQGVYGLGIYSKPAVTNSELLFFFRDHIPSIFVELEHQGDTLGILATHPPPPIGKELSQVRNEQFKEISRFSRIYKKELLVIGDLNSTSFSPNFRLLFEDGRLRDSREGFGLLPTWNARWFPISVALDHALVTEGIEVLNRTTGTDIGSDHLPVVIEVGLRK